MIGLYIGCVWEPFQGSVLAFLQGNAGRPIGPVLGTAIVRGTMHSNSTITALYSLQLLSQSNLSDRTIELEGSALQTI